MNVNGRDSGPLVQLLISSRPDSIIQVDAHTLKRIMIAVGSRLGQDMQDALNYIREADEAELSDEEVLDILQGAAVDFRLAHEATQEAERIHLWIDL